MTETKTACTDKVGKTTCFVIVNRVFITEVVPVLDWAKFASNNFLFICISN